MLARYYGLDYDAFILPLDVAPETVGAFIYEDMKKARITMTRLAEKAGIDISAVSRYISGDRPMTAEKAVQIARVLKSDPSSYVIAQAMTDLKRALKEEEQPK